MAALGGRLAAALSLFELSELQTYNQSRDARIFIHQGIALQIQGAG
jgi:hypothetical protein